MTGSVTIKDRGLARIIGELREASKLHVTVGVHQDAAPHVQEGPQSVAGSEAQVVHEQQPTNAQIAAWNEFGTEDGHVPERSFLRATIDERAKDIRAVQRKALKAVVSGKMDARQGLGVIGEFVKGAVQQKIVSNVPPPNAPSTIALKGSSMPLVDTGQLRQSITYTVEEGAPGTSGETVARDVEGG